MQKDDDTRHSQPSSIDGVRIGVKPAGGTGATGEKRIKTSILATPPIMKTD